LISNIVDDFDPDFKVAVFFLITKTVQERTLVAIEH